MRGFIVVPLTFHYQYSNLSTHNQGSTARFQLRSSVCLLQLAVSVAVTLNRRSLLVAPSSAVPAVLRDLTLSAMMKSSAHV